MTRPANVIDPVAEFDRLIECFLRGNEVVMRSPVRLVAFPAGNLDARAMLESISLRPAVADVVIPHVEGVTHVEHMGFAGVEQNGIVENRFLHAMAGGESAEAALRLFCDLAADAGRLYQRLPSDQFRQGPTTSPRNLWAAILYGWMRRTNWTCHHDAQDYDYIPQPFVASSELLKIFRSMLERHKDRAPALGGLVMSARVTVEWPELAFAQPKWRELAKKWSATFGGTLGKPDRKGDTLLVDWDGPDANALIKAAEAGDLDRLIAAAGGERVSEIDLDGECFYQFVPEVTLPAVPVAIPTAADKFATCARDVDLLLVTSAKIEEDVLLGSLSPWPGEASFLRGALSTITYELGTFGRYRAAHILTTQGGTGREGVTTLVGRAISELRPKAILLLGIAFGVNRRKQRFGDVLVATSVFPYDFERIGADKIVPRGTEMECGRTLGDRFRRRRDWRMTCGLRQVQVHEGRILSGPKLIDNRAFRDELLSKYPTAVGGEMEGAGAYAAAGEAKVEAILVKGICDWADGHKNDRAQPFAAAAAVSLAIHVLSQPDVLKEIGARDFEPPP